MNKTKTRAGILAIILSLILSMSMMMACTPPAKAETGLTAEQQVQIAKDTYTNIYNAIKPTTPTALSVARTSNVSPTSMESDLDGLFEKYPNEDYNGSLSLNYYMLAYPVETLLNEVSVGCIKNNYNVIFSTEDPNMGYFLYPEMINFQGLQVEDGYNKIYSISKIESSLLDQMDVYYGLISYYNSMEDYGFEFTAYRVREDNSIQIGMYYKMDKKTNVKLGIQDQNLNDLESIWAVSKGSKLIGVPKTNISDKAIIENIFQTNYDNFITKSTAIEKSNNNNTIKINTNTITLEYDSEKILQFIRG